MVAVPVEVDKHQPARPYDLLYRHYVNSVGHQGCIVTNMDKAMIEVDQWPLGRTTRAEWEWTIFLSQYVRSVIGTIVPNENF